MFELPQRAIDTAAQVESFFQRCVLPSNRLWEQQAKVGQAVPDILRVLRAEVKELGLWNMVLPRLTDDEPGLGLTNLEFTAAAEILGRLEWASHVFNYNAPDVPNMELLQLFGNEEQKRQWLTPLLEGEIGSAFAMTEPYAASSDPTNLETRIERDGDEFVINGRK